MIKVLEEKMRVNIFDLEINSNFQISYFKDKKEKDKLNLTKLNF